MRHYHMKQVAMTDPNTSHHIDDFSDFYYEEFNDSYLQNISDFDLDENTLICSPITIADAVNISFCVIYVLIFLLAVPGNLIVGWVIGSNKRALSSSDVYLFNLMLADTLLALILPFSAVSVVHGWVFGDAMCKLVCLVKEINFYTSILFLVCISVDRYMVIVRAMESQKAQRRLCSGVACGMVWVLGGVLSLPSLYNEKFYSKMGKQTVCAEQFDVNNADEWRLATRILRHLLGFLLPLVIMLICYSVTVARLLRTRGFQKQRAMKVIVTVVVAFLLCWTPFHVTTIVDTLLRAKVFQFSCSTRTSVDVAMFATQNLGLVHCCVNPVLYAFVGEKFRRRFMQLLQRRGVLDRLSISRSSRSSSVPLPSEITSSFL
ncbi:C-X-C chemokine receptor type 1 isoform X2 [Triplophysa rosa]|uniref:C-X-C chemokine receptor type 1 isoform X2 n=1 Tax=Triplophysa rosa TaxID=992332 RepID=UPI002545C9B0|nr:C-X-C chemokine receptor type 1 isoform X2 [Triplophysa rosa]